MPNLSLIDGPVAGVVSEGGGGGECSLLGTFMESLSFWEGRSAMLAVEW